MKLRCAGCERISLIMNKEHIFPRWLINKTNTMNTGIRWGNKKNVNPLKVTIPLCKECNTEFGQKLEKPVSILFNDIETGKGISDEEAELLIRWLWKIDGLAWHCSNIGLKYTQNYTLKERVLYPIDDIRKHIILAVSLIKELHPESSDYPMGIDSFTVKDAVLVSGVFSMIAIIVTFEFFREFIPSQYSIYKLSSQKNQLSKAKLFFPKTGFIDDVNAVGVTIEISKLLAKLHDQLYGEAQ